MSKSRINLISLCFTLFIIGCSSNKLDNKIIKIELDQNVKSNIKAYAESVIKLETSQKALIGDIWKIEFFDNKLYILDIFYSKALFVFSIDGKFISRTILGHGPGEVMNPFSFYIDKKNSKIMLWDQALSSMFVYDLNLKYLGSQKYDILVRDFAKLGEDTFLLMSYKLVNIIDKSNLNKSKLTTYSLYTNNFKKAIGHFLPVGIDAEGQVTGHPISQFRQTLLIKPWDFTIYKIDNSEAKILYTLDFGKFSFKDSEQENSNDSKWEKVKKGNRIGSLFNLTESENFLTFAVYFRKKATTILYSKKSNNAIQLNSFFNDNSFPECIIGSVVENDTDVFIGIVKDRKFGKSNSNDNPILLFIKIKE